MKGGDMQKIILMAVALIISNEAFANAQTRELKIKSCNFWTNSSSGHQKWQADIKNEFCKIAIQRDAKATFELPHPVGQGYWSSSAYIRLASPVEITVSGKTFYGSKINLSNRALHGEDVFGCDKKLCQANVSWRSYSWGADQSWESRLIGNETYTMISYRHTDLGKLKPVYGENLTFELED